MARYRYEQMLEGLCSDLSQLGDAVDESLQRSIRSWQVGSVAHGRWVLRNERAIDELCRNLERCLIVTFATQQPIVGRDLRLLWVIADIAAELERISDYTASIAQHALHWHELPVAITPPAELFAMADQVRAMLKRSLTAFQEQDVQQARELGPLDDIVDTFEAQLVAALFEQIRANPDYLIAGIALRDVVHALERTADRAVNIGERVIYLITFDTEELDPFDI